VRLTIFGLTLSSSWGNGHATPYRALIRALHRMGHQVIFFEKDVPYYAKRRDFTSCDYCDLVIYPDLESVRSRALLAASESDVVITASYLPQGAQISDEVLEISRPLHVFYDLDTPITLGGLKHGDTDYLRRDQIPAFDLYLSFTGGRALNELRDHWAAREVHPLYGCVDPEVHFRVDIPKPYHCKLSYMGTHATDRQRKLEQLFLEPARALQGEVFVLAGSLYPKNGEAGFDCPPNVRRYEHVGPQDHSALYSSSGATLNITRAEMAAYGYCPSGRLFEAAACSTPILSDEWEGLNKFFSADEIIIVRDTESVLYALTSGDSNLQSMAERARERTLDQHTGDHRARELLNAIERAGNRENNFDEQRAEWVK
jgi:spore maturation protein CgeB